MRIEYHDSDGKNYLYQENFWSGKKNLMVDGESATKLSKKEFRHNETNISVKGSFITGVKLTIDGRVVEICKNKWYEWLLILLPALNLCLGIFGGAVGGGLSGFFGFMAMAFNASVLRTERNVFFKVFACIIIFALSFFVWFGIYLLIVGGISAAFPLLFN